MFERDYVMRLVRQFLEALEKLREKKVYDAYAVEEELHQMFPMYLGGSEAYFCKAGVEEILSRLETAYASGERLYRAEMLAELFFHEGTIKTSVGEQRDLWEKSLFFFEYIDRKSDTFSFERRGKIAKIRELLKR